MRFIWIISLLAVFIGTIGAQELKSGDLLFVMAGESDFSKAISDATGGSENIRFVHVAIVSVEEEVKVIEASPDGGVRKINIDKFLSQAPYIDGHPGVVAKRLDVELPFDLVIANAESYLGEPYDWWYLPDNGKMYCSELIYESYRNKSGERIFQASPMNFRNADGEMPDFWEKLYRNLGMDVPEGLPGTNPQDISKDSRLVEVYRYF